MTILICGGHPNPALALIDQIKIKSPAHNLIYVGPKYNSFEKTVTFEYNEVTSRNVKFINLVTGRLNRILSWQTGLNLLLLTIGFLKSFYIIIRYRPTKILSFGGYIALPLCIWGYIFSIPIYSHEQTCDAGITSRLIAAISKKIFIAFNQDGFGFNKNKTILVGNFIRDEIFTSTPVLNLNDDKPVILIIGGSLGSHSINLLIEKIIPKLVLKYQLVHQTGNLEKYGDWKRLSQLKLTNYHPVKHLSGREMGSYYRRADIIICRSGANTLTELYALKKTAILIPLPWSAKNEQLKQAKLFKDSHCAEIFDQNNRPDQLLDLINKTYKNRNQYPQHFDKLNFLFIPDGIKTYLKEIEID